MTDVDDDWDGDGFDRYGEPDYDDEPDDDRYDEYKDYLAMGYINPDGSQREPDPPEDPWYYRPSLRERIRWRIKDWRRMRRGREIYSDEPPF